MKERMVGAALVCAAPLVAGCGAVEDGEAKWIHLADGFVPAPVESIEDSDDTDLRARRDGGGLWLVTTLERSDWKKSVFPDCFETEVGIRGLGRPRDGSPPQRLSAGERVYDYVAPHDVAGQCPPGSFLSLLDRVFLQLEPGERPPASVELALYVDRGRSVDGRWRARVGRATGDALVVWPGERATRELGARAPGSDTLRFATVVEPALLAAVDEGAEVSFRVAAGGSELFRARRIVREETTVRWHEVALPAGGEPVALSFEVGGDHAFTSFHVPVVGPTEVGTYAERPWEADRPDVVVFLADTFRADNLARHGGEPGVAPNVEAFAAESLVFERARSVCTYTLPAHATMFSGLFPRQHGVARPSQALADEAVTVAEVLSARGYRTGAVTESVLVSELYGLDQGFEWFDESAGEVGDTLARARAFLDADDGRPLFLFVHTYRAHKYRVSEETREELGDRYVFEGEARAIFRALDRGLPPERGTEELAERLRPYRGGDARPVAGTEDVLESLRGLYRGSARDADRAFGEFVADARARGLLSSGHLIFTSDHGEALFEHGVTSHGGRNWEELLRVPFIVHGPTVRPGSTSLPISLIDLPHTICELAGVPPDAGWLGTSVLSLVEERPMFAFQCRIDVDRSALTVIDGERKLFGVEEPGGMGAGRIWAAYDLAEDPGETENQLAVGAEWPEEMRRRLAPLAEALLRPRFGPRAAVLSAEDRELLAEFGYTAE